MEGAREIEIKNKRRVPLPKAMRNSFLCRDPPVTPKPQGLWGLIGGPGDFGQTGIMPSLSKRLGDPFAVARYEGFAWLVGWGVGIWLASPG